jgi:sugar lactone lactonase YvrE
MRKHSIPTPASADLKLSEAFWGATVAAPTPAVSSTPSAGTSVSSSPTPAVEVLVRAYADLGEGPSWLPMEKRLLWVDIPSGTLHFYDPQTGARSSVSKPPLGRIGCAVPTADGRYLLAADNSLILTGAAEKQLRFVDPLTLWQDTSPDAKKVRFNDGKCDPRSRLIVGTMALDMSSAIGCLYAVEPAPGSSVTAPALTVRKIAEGLVISNGLAWTRDGRTLYLVDSVPKSVYQFDYDLDAGTVSNRTVAIETSRFEPKASPDGMCIDSDEMLWVAFYSGSAVLRFDPRAKTLLAKIVLPATHITCPVFGGASLDEMYVTSACQNIPREEWAEKDGKARHEGALFRIRGTGCKALAAAPCFLLQGKTV